MFSRVSRTPFYLGLYMFIGGLYLLTASGRIGLSDNVAMFNVTLSIADEGSFSSEPCDPNLKGHPNHCVYGRDGRYYAGFGLVPSIVAVPTIMSAKLVSRIAHVNMLSVMRLSVSLFTALISPLACVVLAAWIIKLGYSRLTAIAGAVGLAFVTPFWHYAVKGFYSEPYFTLSLVLAAYLVSCSELPFASGVSGLAFGAACGCRVIGMIMFPAFILFLVLKNRERQLSKVRLSRDLVFFTTAFGVCVALIGWSNYVRFGDPLKTGYQLAFPSASALFSNHLFQGMSGLLFSNEVGLLIFAPWVVLALIWFRSFAREHMAESVLCATIFLVNFFFFSKYPSWHGGMVAGPRFLVPTLPFLVLILVPHIEDIYRASKAGRFARLFLRPLAAIFVIAGFLVQTAGVFYPESRYYILTSFYEEKSTKPWWNGSIPLASLDFLSQIATSKGEHAESVQSVNSDALSVGREAELAYASMPTAASEQDFLSLFPNSVNLVLPDLMLAKIKPLGLPRAVFYLYVVISGIGCLFGIMGIRKGYRFDVVHQVSEG